VTTDDDDILSVAIQGLGGLPSCAVGPLASSTAKKQEEIDGAKLSKYIPKLVDYPLTKHAM
jgi:hypothetical protein